MTIFKALLCERNFSEDNYFSRTMTLTNLFSNELKYSLILFHNFKNFKNIF